MKPRYVYILVGILCILVLYMAFCNPTQTRQPTIEAFSFVDKPKPTKLGERRRRIFWQTKSKGLLLIHQPKNT